MQEELPGVVAKITNALSRGSEYVVTQPAELYVFRQMSDIELDEFARNHGWRVIRRLGGRQLEFYNEPSQRAL